MISGDITNVVPVVSDDDQTPDAQTDGGGFGGEQMGFGALGGGGGEGGKFFM